jgi:membrane protein required for colicin V production
MNINWLDAAILLTFFWFGFTGLTAGLVRSGLTMLAFLLGVVLAGLFYQRLASDLHVIIGNETAAKVVAVLAIFGAASLAGQLLAIFLKQAVAVLFFGPLDGAGGLVLGLIKAFILVELVLIVFVTYRYGVMTDALNHSSLASVFLDHVPVLTHILPSDFRNAVNQFTQATS